MTQDDIEKLFQSYSDAWRANSAERIASHWDAAHFNFYKAEEIDGFYRTWEDVLTYWRHNEGFHDAVELRFSDIQPLPVSTDWAVCTVRMRWDILFSKTATLMDGGAFGYRGVAMGGDNHVLTLLRHGDDGPKLAGWSETPDAPITYMSNLYTSNLSPGFPPKD